MQHHFGIIKRGAEADVYLTDWYGKKAILKKRTPKEYRHKILDSEIRKKRTLNEANMIFNAKRIGLVSPFIYFVDPVNAEIVMEFIRGRVVKDNPTQNGCFKMGKCTALLHENNIIHGDLTTSNFILKSNGSLAIIDFGLSYHSERIEDRAVDVRLIKEIFSSAHFQLYNKIYDSFIDGYQSQAGEGKTNNVLQKVLEIEKRGRYARVV